LTEKRLNILFLASWYPNKVFPKNGNFVQKHAQAVSQHCNVAVLHIIANTQDQKFEVETTDNNGVLEVIVYYKKIKGSSPIHKYQKLKRRHEAHVLGYHKVLNTIGKIDLTHLNVTYPAGLFALYLKQRHKIPYIITEHSTAYLPSSTHQFSKIETKWIKKIGLNASIICPVSEGLADSIEQFGVNNTYEVVPNVVNTTIFKPTASKQASNKIRILHISNLKDEQKNITGILNVIKKLSDLRKDFTLTILGEGNTEHYKQKAKSLKITENVIRFESEKTTTEVAKLINSNDLFLLFSNYETFSVVIAEAWACGLPVITSKCGGLTETITKENGIQVKVGDEAELLNQLNTMLNQITTYNPEVISTQFGNKFSYETVGNTFLTIYKRTLQI